MKQDRPIINSMLDTDFYTFTVGQWVWRYFPEIPVTYSLINRKKSVPLARIIDMGELREQLDHARTLSFTNHDLHDVGGTFEYGDRMFLQKYVEDFLKNFQLPEYNLERDGDQYRLEFSGFWRDHIYWETIALPIVNELYTRHFLDKMTRFEKDVIFSRIRVRLDEKVEILRRHPGVTFSDFGTRRRFSHANQDYVVGVLAEELPGQFLGSSNMCFAMKYGLMPMGTVSHQKDMIMASLFETKERIRQSIFTGMQLWWDMYGHGLSIFLPDTFGSQFFFENASAEVARNWKGGRQDSGDPWVWGRWLLDFYKRHEVDAKTKMFLATDGLNVEKVIQLWDFFHRDFKTVSFGIGTNLTFDVPFFPARPISLVVKPTKACGKDLFKLSDNIQKATGTPEAIEKGKRIFGYAQEFSEECIY